MNAATGRDSVGEDRADVARVLAGDVSAYENIVRRWQGPIVNLAWRFCHDRGRAEELAQEVFLRAWRALHTWRGDSAFSTWLFALAANVYRTELRRIPVRSVGLDDVRALCGNENISCEIEQEQRDQIIRTSVSALPEKYRDVMIMFYFLNRDIQETARTLGVPEGTVKARLARGRDLLRAKLPPLLGRMDGRELL